MEMIWMGGSQMNNENIGWVIIGACIGTLGIIYLVNPEITKFALAAFAITLPLSFSRQS